MEHTSGGSSWCTALRLGGALLPHPSSQRTVWSLLVPIVAPLAGLRLSISAHGAEGTALRDDRNPQVNSLIADRKRPVDQQEKQAAGLRREVDQHTTLAGDSDADIAAEQRQANARRSAAGLSGLHGSGLMVRLDDAPRRTDGGLPPGAGADDLVVHQQDVQTVVNALWRGGAETITIMGARVSATSAVKCVGDTLLLNGRVCSPPFVITEIGDPAPLRAALHRSDGVKAFAFQEAVSAVVLGYQVKPEADATVPGHDGSAALPYAQPAG